MATQNYTLNGFADLIQRENQRGIINGRMVMGLVAAKGIPKIIRDIRGAVRLSIERSGDEFTVTKYTTELVKESLLAIH